MRLAVPRVSLTTSPLRLQTDITSSSLSRVAMNSVGDSFNRYAVPGAAACVQQRCGEEKSGRFHRFNNSLTSASESLRPAETTLPSTTNPGSVIIP